MTDERDTSRLKAAARQLGSDDLLVRHEIAEATRVPIETIRWWRKNGLGPRTWICGGRLCAWRSDVQAWLDAQAEATSRGGVGV